MKNLLGLLALTAVVSGVATAEQKFVTKVVVGTEAVATYGDTNFKEDNIKENTTTTKTTTTNTTKTTKTTTKTKENKDTLSIGNEFFKRENLKETTWEKWVAVDVQFDENWTGTFKLSPKVTATKDNEVVTELDKDKKEVKKVKSYTKEKSTVGKFNAVLNRKGTIGNLETNWRFAAEKLLDKNWKYTVGAKFGLYGTNVDTFVNYHSTDNKYDYNFNVVKSGTVVEGDYGKLSYGLEFKHKYDIKQYKETAKNDDVRNTDKLDLTYVQKLAYETPKYYGLGLKAEAKNTLSTSVQKNPNVDDEFVFNVNLGYSNDFSFNTSVGKITLTPSLNYDIFNRNTKYALVRFDANDNLVKETKGKDNTNLFNTKDVNYGSDRHKTTETNALTAGLTFTLVPGEK